MKTRWQLSPQSPLALQLAADARLSQTDYFDDQVWELALGTPGNPALALQTNYGGRIGLASLLPLWRVDNRAVYQYQAYSTPPVITTFTPGYAQASAMITPNLALRADFWVMESHAVGARLIIKNSGSAVDLGLDLVGFAAAEGRELKLSVVTDLEGGAALSFGKIGTLRPLVLLENARGASSNTLSLDFNLAANEQVVVRWVHAARANPGESASLAQRWLQQNWNTPFRRITQAAQAIPSIETGDANIDAVLAFSYQQLIQSFLKPTASLPYASFVASRQPGRGYSPRGDGKDHPRGWNGQTPTLAYLSALAVAPVNADIAQGIVRNYLAVQHPDGWIDWKPGLAGQQQGVLCLPILARLTWGIWQYTTDDQFLRDVFPGLLRFFERWLAEDVDGDGFPEWQNETQMGYPFMPSFALGLPWGQNADIRYFETPDLLAYLLSEALSLREIAYYLRRASDEERMSAHVNMLTERLENLWNTSEQRYTYRDRDTHRTGGSVSVLQDGRGDENHILALKLDPPNRLIVRITGGASHIPKIKLRLSGLGLNGQPVQEDADTFTWTPGRGVYTSRTVFSQIDRLQVEGLSTVYHVSTQTVDTTGFDLNGLLPLWSVGIAPARAAALVQHLTNPAEFWRKNGLLMFSAQDAYFDPARAEGSLGVWLYWLTLIGEGLIEQGRIDLAAELVQRILAAQAIVLRDAKAFYEFYHADEARGLGERGSIFGLAPLHLLLRVLGVRILSKTRVWAGGSFPWSSPVTVSLHGVTVRRSTQGTEIRFPSGDSVNLPANAPWQEISSPKSS